MDVVDKKYILNNKEYCLRDIILDIRDNLDKSKKLKGILFI